MMGEYLPTGSIPTRPDASQSTQSSQSAFYPAFVHPTTYETQELSRSPFNLLQNPTPPGLPFPAALYGVNATSAMPSYQDQGPASIMNPPFIEHPLLSQDMYTANGVPSVPGYHGQGNACLAANLTPNYTPLARTLPPQYTHGASDVCSLPNYDGQGNVFPVAGHNPDRALATLPLLSQDVYGTDGTPSAQNFQDMMMISPSTNLDPNATFAAHYLLAQRMRSANGIFNHQVPNNPSLPPTNLTFLMNTRDSCQPFTGMLPSDATVAFLQPQDSGSHNQVVPQWSLPTLPPVTTAVQEPPQCVVQRDPPNEPQSDHEQTNVASDGAFSRQVSPKGDQRRWKELCWIQLQVKGKASKIRRGARISTNEDDSQEQYYCKLCDKWVLVHRMKYHDQKHAPNAGKFVCKICEVLEEPCKPLSRKDALKRHIDVQHPKLAKLLKNRSLKLLVPRRKHEREDLEPLRKAMNDAS